ncbi:MAG: hypothetical protein WA160_00240 [Pseudobdellovibrio sp.]
METGLTRNEKIYLILAVFVAAVVFLVFKKLNFKSSTSSQYETVEAINYQMVRPEAGYAGYSLEGREIDEHYEALKAKQIAQKKVIEQAKVDAKNKKAAVAKVDAKKKAAVATAAQTKQAIQNAKIVQAAQMNKYSKTADLNSDNKKSDSFGAANDIRKNSEVDQVVATSDAAQTKKNFKSFAQWRAEIFAKPSQEIMSAFITAFRKNEVSETEYQAMAQDLVDQNDVKFKGLGLMALRAQPSLSSLSQLVHIEAQLPSDLQAYVQQAYLVYSQPQSVGIMIQVLQTKDKALVVKSLSLLAVNLEKIKVGDVSAFIEARNRREAASEAITLNNYKALLPTLSSLASSGENDVTAVAQKVVTLIQSSGTVAVN